MWFHTWLLLTFPILIAQISASDLMAHRRDNANYCRCHCACWTYRSDYTVPAKSLLLGPNELIE